MTTVLAGGPHPDAPSGSPAVESSGDEPSRRTGRLPHLPALDGLRGVAVVMVLLFHGGVQWAQGGWLGVSMFFTLSGFLITNLLVGEWSEHGTVSLRRFWGRRVRRLLPASLLCIALVAMYGAVWATPQQLHDLRGDVLAAVGYVANWRFLFNERSYADLFSAPSPLQHFWSLAIEEQFYLVYPLVVLGLLKVGGRRALVGGLVGATLASVAWGLHLDQLDRVYYGTDTRMAELLAGGLLALWWSRPVVAAPRRARRGVTPLAVAGLVGTLALLVLVDKASPSVTNGVLALQALLSVAIIQAAPEEGPVARLLGRRPLVGLGAISYGLYLFHWPLFLLLDEDRVGVGGLPLVAVRLAATLGLAVVSYVVVEQPIRRRRILPRALPAFGTLATATACALVLGLVVTASPPEVLIAHAETRPDQQTIDVKQAAASSAAPVAAGVPRSVMLIGDSGTFDLAPGLFGMFDHLGMATWLDASWPGFSLTGPDFRWRDQWPPLVAEKDPRLVVIMLGAWDLSYIEEHGAAAYDRVIDDAVAILTARGAKILWVSMLRGEEEDTRTMDERFMAAAGRHPDSSAYIDVEAAMQGPAGDFPRWLPATDGGWVLARKPDGWHLCPDGAARLAQAIGMQAARVGLSAIPTPGWEQGGWRANKRFNDPPGGCDPARPGNRRV